MSGLLTDDIKGDRFPLTPCQRDVQSPWKPGINHSKSQKGL